MKIKCGDANPKGNISFLFKGGCEKEVDIKDAYRCTGCGGWFHLDCIFKHFEMEKGHDYSRNALKKIKMYVIGKTTSSKQSGEMLFLSESHISKLCDEGLDRKPDKKRLKI